MIRYTNQAVKEIVTGILIYGFVCTLIILFFVEGGQLLSALAGLALGIFRQRSAAAAYDSYA